MSVKFLGEELGFGIFEEVLVKDLEALSQMADYLRAGGRVFERVVILEV